MRVLRSAFVLLSMCLLIFAAHPASAATGMAALPLQELPQSGGISAETTTLTGIVQHYRAIHQMPERLALYIWKASVEGDWRKAPIQRTFVTELKQLQGATSGAATRAISVVAVYGSDGQRQDLYRRIQRMMRDEGIDVLTVVDSSRGFADAVARSAGAPRASTPELVLVNAADLKVTARRGDDPVWAEAWLKLVGTEEPAELRSAIEKLPADCKASWFWRSIRMAEQAELIPHAPGRFEPLKEVTDTEFGQWLGRIDATYAQAVSQTGGTITRERAFAATVKAMFGDDPAKVLEALPPPPQEVLDQRDAVGASGGQSWLFALGSLDGSENISAALRPHMALALAAGLLYDQPSLHAKWPLTREVAAWLLAHVLVARSQQTGVVIDAVDVAFERDRRFGSNPIVAETAEGGMERVYPRPAPRSPAPILNGGFALAVHALAGSSLAEHRVGARPVVVKAKGVGGSGVRAKELVISQEDAAAVMAANQRSMVLDFWRVAIIYGVGARLIAPAESPARRDSEVVIAFSVPMRAEAVNGENVRLIEVASGERAATEVSYDEGSARATLRPAERLKPGTRYAVVLGGGLLSADGGAMAAEAGLPEGQARRWEFVTSDLLRVRLEVSALPAGTPVYVNETRVGEGAGSFEVEVPPGPFRVRAKPGDAEQVVELTAEGDGTLEAPMTPPMPAQIVMSATTQRPEVGGDVEVMLTPVDSSGAALKRHQPVSVEVAVRRGTGSESKSAVVRNGAGTVAVAVTEPGLIFVEPVEASPSVPITPVRLELRGRVTTTDAEAGRGARQCGALVIPALPEEAMAGVLEKAVRSMLESRGYLVRPAEEVAATWQVASQSPRPTGRDAEVAMDCLNLNEVFVFELSRSPSSDCVIAARIWSRDAAMNWPGASDSLQPIMVGRRATEADVRKAVEGYLAPWFSRVGLEARGAAGSTAGGR